MSPTMEYTETLIVTHCWCGIALAIPSNLHRWAKDDDRHAVFCPIGHEFVFNENYRDKLEREQQRHRATKDLLKAEERSHSATKGQLTKTRKRVHAGVCPHCKRHFANVERHMQSKHAEEIAAA